MIFSTVLWPYILNIFEKQVFWENGHFLWPDLWDSPFFSFLFDYLYLSIFKIFLKLKSKYLQSITHQWVSYHCSFQYSHRCCYWCSLRWQFLSSIMLFVCPINHCIDLPLGNKWHIFSLLQFLICICYEIWNW